MNYLELINLTLQELNFKTVDTFSALVKPDHKRILNIVNRVNDIILDSCDWQFMMREYTLDIPKGASGAELPEMLKIKTIFDNGEPLVYTEEYERHLNGRGFVNEFALFGGKLLVAPQKRDRSLKIIYATKNHAKNAQGQEIPRLVRGDDETLIPPVHAQNVIVYGSCLQFKSSPEHPKYKYWLGMFTDSRAAMRASNEYISPKAPRMTLPRWAYGFDRY